MSKKKTTPKEPADTVLVTAAKTIGKVAGKIAAVVSGTAKLKGETAKESQLVKKPIKSMSKVTTKKRVAPRAGKAVAKRAGGSKTKPPGRGLK